MVTTEEITKAEMLTLYSQALVFDPINTGDRIYARTSINQGDKSEAYKVVWCNI